MTGRLIGNQPSNVVLLFSSAGEIIFEQFILSVLAYPEGHILVDIPYGLNRVHDDYKRSPQLLRNKQALIIFLGYNANKNNEPQQLYCPLRQAVILSSRIFAGKLLLDVKLGNYIYYQDGRYEKWQGDIKAIPGIPEPQPKINGQAMVFNEKGTWRSGGLFVLDVKENLIDISISKGKEAQIRKEAEDWKSVVDKVSGEKPFSERLFYQICSLQRGGSGEPIKLMLENGRSMFSVVPGQSIDLILHFYPGRSTAEASTLTVKVNSELVSLVGQGTIEVHRVQSSGKVERVQLLVKRRLSSEITPVILYEEGKALLKLARTEVYLKIHSTRMAARIFLLFFLGSFLAALPTEGEVFDRLVTVVVYLFDHGYFAESLKLFWVLKLLGSFLMALSFWMAFSKFPTKE